MVHPSDYSPMISLINSHSPPLFRHKHVYKIVVRRSSPLCPRFTVQPASVFWFYLAGSDAIISGICFSEGASGRQCTAVGELVHVPFLPSFSLCSRLRKGLCILVQRTSPCVLMLLLSFWACSRPEPRFGIRLSVIHVKACDLSGWTGWRDMSDCPVPGGSGWGAVGRALCLPEKSSFFAALKPAGS